MSAVAAPLFAGVLAVLGATAAAPASSLFARATWSHRSPQAALVLWQSVCLCAGLSMTGAALVLGVAPLGDRLPAALAAWAGNVVAGDPFRDLTGWRVALLVIALLFALALLVALIRSSVLAVRRRRSHRRLLDLLTGPGGWSGAPDSGVVRVLDHSAPLAWSVPGWNRRLVLTAGLIDLLTPAQVDAVIAHERAHLSLHHDLLLLPFQAWVTALGRLPGVRAARGAVAVLAEMQADDVAARAVDAETVMSALAAVALADRGVLPAGESAAETADVASTAVTERVRRLRRPRPFPASAVIAVYLLAAVLLVVPASVLFVPWTA